MLVNWTRIGRATCDLPPHEWRAIPRARNVEVARHVAGVRAAAAAEHAQGRPDRPVQLAPLVGPDVDGRSRRIDAGAPQRLVHEQIAQTRDTRLVHQHSLDRRGTPAERVIELRGRQGERVGAEP